MPNLSFSVESAEALLFAAAPTIAFNLKIANLPAEDLIQSIALRCQILIEASRRHYNDAERDSLRDLFGERDRWRDTLRSFLWCHTAAAVPEFSGSAITPLPVSCTFDFNVAATKYFHAATGDDDIPLCFQFSGTVFYPAVDGTLQISQIGWDKEARFRLPARVWREMMEHYYPNSTWLRLRRDTFERLYEYKRAHGLATWEQAIENLLPLKNGKEIAS